MENLKRVYRCRAEVKEDGDRLLVITDSRDRAVHYFKSFSNSGCYLKVWVEVGAMIFDKVNMEELP